MQKASISYQESPVVTTDFSKSLSEFESLLEGLKRRVLGGGSLADLEEHVFCGVRELGATLLQQSVDIAASSKATEMVVGSDGKSRPYSRKEPRKIVTRFGPITVERYRYEGKGVSSISPFDAHFNLPKMGYSYGVQRLVALLASLCSYEETINIVEKLIGVSVPKRQAEEIARAVSQNGEQYYKETALSSSPEETSEILVQSYDGKGIPMLKNSLRKKTAAAQSALPKDQLAKKFKRGIGKHKKRSAQVSAVYTVAPFERSAEQIVAAIFGEGEYERQRPKPENKQVGASVARPRKQVIEAGFLEAFKRDPDLKKQRVVLVDGDPGQIDIIKQTAKKRNEPAMIVVDLLHVLSYLWKAGKRICSHTKQELHPWVKHYLLKLLSGQSQDVEAHLNNILKTLDLNGKSRKAVRKCVVYLKNHHDYLRYDKYIKAGYPICTGVIEGACRYLVRDRMEKTGCRWSVAGAEAILYLRALVKNGDYEEYWEYHMAKEFEKNHQGRYKNGVLPKMDKPIPGTTLRLL